MEWKPNTIYKLLPKISGNRSYTLKTCSKGIEVTIIKEYNTHYKIGQIKKATSFERSAFEEVKPKINHLPDWM